MIVLIFAHTQNDYAALNSYVESNIQKRLSDVVDPKEEILYLFIQDTRYGFYVSDPTLKTNSKDNKMMDIFCEAGSYGWEVLSSLQNSLKPGLYTFKEKVEKDPDNSDSSQTIEAIHRHIDTGETTGYVVLPSVIYVVGYNVDGVMPDLLQVKRHFSTVPMITFKGCYAQFSEENMSKLNITIQE